MVKHIKVCSQIAISNILGVTWRKSQNDHAVESEYFLKIYFKRPQKMEDLIRLCNLIYENPEPGYERRQPHAITNAYVYSMIQQWQST